jgi:hypothetical protein
MSPFALRPDGSIVLPDDDGEPVYYLQPDAAFDLSEFITLNRDSIQEAQDHARRTQAYRVLGECIAAGLPTPTLTRLRWDGRLVVDTDTAENFDAWVTAIAGTTDVDEHPTLGRRKSHTTSHLIVEGPWVAAESVPA